MRKLYVLLMALFVGFMANSQVSTYTFNQAAGTYSSVSGGTVLGTTSNDEEVFNNSTAGGSAPVTATGFPIGFTFTYRGVSFDKFAVATNGYIVLGTGSFSIANTTTTAISTSTTSGFTNLISGFNQDLQGQTGSELSYQLTGSSPNRVLVVQWKNYKRYNGTGTMNYNFQIRLSEGTNTIDFVYGAMTTVTSYTAQVGLRGTSNTDYNTRTTTTNWLATTLGSAATSTITLSASVYPVSGTTYTFTPTAIPPCTAPTTQATAFVPGTATSSTAPGSFTAASGTPSGYLVVRSVGTFMGMPVDGTTYVAGNTIGNGTVVQSSVATTFTASTLTGNTNYTFTLLSYNTGSCSGGPKYYTTSPLTGNATTCPATPSSLSVTNLTTNGGRINWASSGGGGASAITYTLDVTTDAAFASPISGSPFTVSDATAVANVVSYDVSGLNAATTYYYRIKASGCNTVTASSSFVTSCAAISAFPYTQGFETTGLPGCWTSSEGAPGASYHWTTTAADATYGVAGPQSGSRFAFLYVFLAQVTYNPYYLNSPSFVLDATPRQIAYYYYLGTGGYKGTTGATGADPYPLELQITTDNGATWTSIYSHSTTNSTFATTTAVSNWKLTTVDLSTYVGQTVAFRFKSNSNYGSGILDQGVDNFSIDIVPTCAAPVPGSATGITTTSATLNWAAPTATPASYEIYYSTSSTPPTVSTVPTTTGIITTSQTVTSLTAATTYYAWVRSNCGAGLVSSWSGSAVSLTTPCPAVNIPYTQNFNTVTAPSIPGCTVVENANADAQTWRTVSSISGVASVTSNALGYQYSSTLAANDWYFIQALSLTAGNSYTLRFKYLASSAPTYVEKLKVVLGTAQQSSAMTGAVLFNNNNITNTGYVEAVVDFTVPTSGDYVIGFQAYSAANQDFLVIDDIGVDITPLCATPTAVNATNVTTTGVTLNWTAPAATPAGYEIYYSTTNTAPTGSTVPTVTGVATTSQAISGLNNATTYYAWVRSNCGRGLVSDWSGSPITFATACGILNIPYVQDFNTVTLPAVPYCTLVENTNADANTWKTIAAGSTTAITSIALDYGYNSTTAANDWFFTPKLNLSAGTNYTLRFKYLATNSSYPEKFKVVTGTDQTSASMTGATLFNATGIANTSYKDTSIVFTVPSSGVYVFGFQVYSDADEDNLVIDDISIDVTPLCATPTAPMVSNLLTTSGTLTWSGTGSYLLEYGAAGFTPGTGITAGTGGTLINPATSPVNITGLTLSTAYDVYVRQNCTSSGNGYSANTAKLSFTTPAFDNDNASGAVTLTHTMYSSACTGTVYSTVGATASSETSTCFSASQDDDVWFKFVATDTKAILKLSNYTTASGTPGTFYYGIYSGTPGTLAEVNCDLSSVVSTTNGGGEIYIPAVLNVGTTYYIRALTGGTGGRATFNLCVMSPDVSANTTANTCVAAQTFDISGGLTTLWVPLFMADGKLVGEINANGNTLGSTTVKVYRNTNAVRKDFYNKSYLDRNIEITPTTQPTSGTVSVRLYFTNAELTALQNDPGSQVTSSSDLGVFKNSQSCAVSVGAGAAPVAGATTTSYGSNYYIGFDVSSFSTFYVASKNFASLPANILTFSGLRQGAANNLKWTVAQETDVQVYGIERSEDGNRWSTVGTVNSLGNTTQQHSYTFSDNNISGLKQLYRLRQTDRNGSVKISNTIVINGTKATLLTLSGLFPNPASGKVNLLVDAPVKDNITIVVMDAVGRIVKTQKAAVDAGSNTLELNVASLAGGSYLMKLTCDGNCQSAVSKFVKE